MSQEIISGNFRQLQETMSNNLPQFLIASQIFGNAPNKRSNFSEHDWSKFNSEEFILYSFSIG